jgi:putative endonuclease
MNYPIFYTYIVKCADGTFYTGSTEDLELRLKEHNGELIGGAKYTLEHRPVALKHFEEFKTREEAEKREKEIKKMPHAEKEVVCETGNRMIRS